MTSTKTDLAYHQSKVALPIGTVLEPRGYPFISEPAEAILEATRPEGFIEREKSIYLSSTAECAKTGVKYSGGFVYEVELLSSTTQHDLSWTGELQRRHPRSAITTASSIDEKIALRMKPDPVLAHMSDHEIAERYPSAEHRG